MIEDGKTKSKIINYEPDYDDMKGDLSSLLEKIKARISNRRDSTLEKEKV